MTPPVIKLDFNITNRCNFRCLHCCFSSGEGSENELSFEKITHTLREFHRLGGQRIDITGGEPLLRKDIGKVVLFGKKLGLKIEINTNGFLATRKRLKSLKKVGLDGSSYEIYKKIRPVEKEVYKEVVSNIQNCVELGFATKINTVAFKSNLADIPKITEMCLRLKIREHGLYYFTPVGRGANHFHEIIEPTIWLKFLRKNILQFKDKVKLSIETPIIENGLAQNLETSCYLKNPWHLQILSDGQVYPCAIMASRKKPCGNIHRQTLSEIWRQEKLWNQTFYQNSIVPFFEKFGGCLNFGSDFKEKVKSQKYCFVCPMRKYKPENFYV